MLGFKLKFLLLFVSVFFAQTALCNGPTGGEITYRYLGNNKYYVEASLLRDCRTLWLTDLTFGWYAGNGSNTSCGSGTLKNFKRVKITDITEVHSSLKKPCFPNGASKAGTELHTYVDTIDLSKSPFASVISNSACTELSFYVYHWQRSTNISTGSANDNFTITATLYFRNLAKCANKNNSSPFFQRNYPEYNSTKAAAYWSLGAVDSIDRDSLSFQLAPALSYFPASFVRYNAPFSFQYPVSSYCPQNPSTINCTPNIKTVPPRGTYLNPITGELIYTPIKRNEHAIIAILVSEFRRDSSGKMQLIARNRRDATIITKDTNFYNNEPTISGHFEISVGAGSTVCNTFTINDNKFSSFQSNYDTIQVNWAGSSAEPTWKFSRDSLNPSRGSLEFCWKTNSSNYTGFPYTFTIFVSDNHYPTPKSIVRTFTVNVKKLDTAYIKSVVNLQCASADLMVSLKKGDVKNGKYGWEIRDSITKKPVAYVGGAIVNVPYLKPGTYEAILTVQHAQYGYEITKHYFTMNAIPPKVSLGADQRICKGNRITIGANLVQMKAPFKYNWFINKKIDTNTASTLSFSYLDTNKVVMLEVKDSLGCTVRDTLNITSLAIPKVAWTIYDTTLCWSPTTLNLNSLIKLPEPSFFNTTNIKIRGALNQYSPAGLVDTSQAPTYSMNLSYINNDLDLQDGKFLRDTLTLWYKDSNGCENTAQTQITINGRPLIQLSDTSICQNSGSTIFLDNLVIHPKNSSGTNHDWSLISGPKVNGILSTVNYNFTFRAGENPDNSYSGNYALQFCVADQATACKHCDTNTITVLPQFDLQALNFTPVCENSSTVDLSSYFLTNGKTSSPATSNYTIISRDGNIDPKTWSNASLISGYIIPKNMPVGKWNIAFTPEATENYCAQTITHTFEILPNPIAGFVTTPADSTGSDVPLFRTNNTSNIADKSALRYTWYFNYPDLNNSSVAYNPEIYYPSAKANYTVWLIATSTNGCSDTAVKTLKVGSPAASASDLEVDGIRINLKFQVSGFEYRSIHTQIFDAAGKSVADNTSNDAIELSTGIYYYQIRLEKPNGETLNLQGKRFVP
jgi:hypothetical protein